MTDSNHTLGDILRHALNETTTSYMAGVNEFMAQVEIVKKLNIGQALQEAAIRDLQKRFLGVPVDVRNSPAWIQHLANGRKIEAIKELRTINHYDNNYMGLRGAKDVVEAVQSLLR